MLLLGQRKNCETKLSWRSEFMSAYYAFGKQIFNHFMFRTKRQLITVWVLSGVPPCTSIVFSQITLTVHTVVVHFAFGKYQESYRWVVLSKPLLVRGASVVPVEKCRGNSHSRYLLYFSSSLWITFHLGRILWCGICRPQRMKTWLPVEVFQKVVQDCKGI